MSEMYRAKVLSAKVVTRPDDEVMRDDEPGDQGASWAEALLGVSSDGVDWHSSWDEYVAWLREALEGREKESIYASLKGAGWTRAQLLAMIGDPKDVPWELRGAGDKGATALWYVMGALAELKLAKAVPALRVECELVTAHSDASRLMPGLDRWLQLAAFGARVLAEADEGGLEDSPVVRDLVGLDTYSLWGPGAHEQRAADLVWGAYIASQTPLRFNDEAWLNSQGKRWWVSKTEPASKLLRKAPEGWVRDIDPAQWSATTVVLFAHPAYLPRPRKKAFDSCAFKGV